ncbi:uncharacterized protein LOC126967893 [Leptidea sinapis]|uniref:uncharacterized protein LOC126967893 n=1 Tax=Leptidea sinapis TaxID=189913 RepID=UPI002123A342|nr:uncharacterized protein LOC126967893 [Leptidea sinapis]
MVRWRTGVVLAMLFLMPAICQQGSEDNEDEEDKSQGSPDEDEDEDNEDTIEDEPEPAPKPELPVRRAPMYNVIATKTVPVTRTTKRRPLECFVCAYKPETPLRACLDPIKFRVHTMTCHNLDDKCVTSVISKGNSYEAITRGCRSSCLGSPETTCCELDRCNNQALAMPTVVAPRAIVSGDSYSKALKLLATPVLFFVTILLLLQTVVKVNIV